MAERNAAGPEMARTRRSQGGENCGCGSVVFLLSLKVLNSIRRHNREVWGKYIRVIACDPCSSADEGKCEIYIIDHANNAVVAGLGIMRGDGLQIGNYD